MSMHNYTESECRFIQEKFDLNNTEMDVFMSAAHRYGLNPIAMEIYPQLRNDNRTGKRNMVIATGINGYRVLADRTGAYAGNSDPVFDDESKPTVATVTVFKVVGGVKCDFSATARWDQYFPGDKQGFMWRKMPHLMLGKVAEALALRKAFPAAMSGIYTDTEMEQAGATITEAKMQGEEPPATSQVSSKTPPPAQRAVPEAPKPAPKPKATAPVVEKKKSSPKEGFVNLLEKWTGLAGKPLMEKAKEIAALHDVPTDGSAHVLDFLCCFNFCERQMDEMSVEDAISLFKSKKEQQSDEAQEESEF